MNREEFLTTILKMYPNSFNDGNRQLWMNGYKRVLSERLDFDHLLDKLLTEYTSIHTAPAPAWFTTYVPLVMPKAKKQAEKVKEGVPPPKEIKENYLKVMSNTTAKSKFMAS